MNESEKIIVYTDGGSRGNPGKCGAGVYITGSTGEVIEEIAEYLGEGTNNYAEYQAAIIALQALKKRYGEKTSDITIELRLDSELVVKQLNGEYKVKNKELLKQFLEIQHMREESFPLLTVTHVRREKNTEADRLANEAMDMAT